MSFLSGVGESLLEGLQNDLGAIGSNWGSLNPDLIATITPCDDTGTIIDTSTGIAATLKDGNIEQNFNWQSPFEGMTPESRHPTLMAALQSGGLGQAMQSLSLLVAGINVPGIDKSTFDPIEERIKEVSDKAKGRTGITKMNSRQIFAGHEPLKITATLIFRAYQDPKKEVMDPFWRLVQMAYPSKMANNYLDAIKDGKGEKDGKGIDEAIETFLPSKAPGFVSFSYKKETYGPLVIENLGKPLDAPYSTMGDVFLEVPSTLGTLRSLDGVDIAGINNRPGKGVAQTISDLIAPPSSLF